MCSAAATKLTIMATSGLVSKVRTHTTSPSWPRVWLQGTGTAALILTVFDAFLLQQKKAFFTGGFLAINYTRSLPEAVGFLLASLVSDAAIAGVLVAAALWLGARARLTASARRVVALLAALVPLLTADLLMYRLLSYVGDAFDLSLMFDLTGRNPTEILAVASRHLVAPLLVVAAAASAGVALVWIVNRLRAAARSAIRIPARILLLAAALFVGGGIFTAIISAASDTYDDGLGRKPSGRLLSWLTGVATDVDRDGYGVGGTLSDPDPFDPSVYPYAVDRPGNGIDEDGVGGDLPSGVPPYQEGASAHIWQRKPNVVLIVLESFRADAVGRVVNGKPVSPVLDALARQGVSASLAFSHNGYTAQSRFHIFSGSLADLRGHRTLIDDFKANGYEVGYFSGQDDSFGGPAFGVGLERADVAYDARQDRGRRYTTFTTAGSLAVSYETVVARVATFLAHRDPSRPLFLYINLYDTHYPYHHNGIQPLVSTQVVEEAHIEPSHKSAVQEMYFNTAANVDAAVGSSLDLIRRHLSSPPAIIVTGDHGESLFDEGFLGHGYALNDVQTRIPLIATGLPLVIEEPFGQADLRDAIGAALAAPAGDMAPRVVRPAGKQVFQYLGNIDRPREIGFATAETRTIYDFRTQRVRLNDGSWHRPEDLDGQAGARFLELVRLWERMMLARASGARHVDH